MTSPVIPAVSDALTSRATHQQTLRWIMLGIVALAAFLVAIVGQPPAQPAGPGGPHSGFVGVSHQARLNPHG